MLSELLFDGFSPWFFLIEFLCAGLVIFYTGHYLAKSSAVIAENTGIGQTWMGLTLLSVITSLPEVSVNFSAIALDAPEIIGGNIFGSNAFNIFIIGILDLIQGKGGITKQVNIRQILPVGLSIALTSLAIIGILTMKYAHLNPDITGLTTSAMVFILFLSGNRMVYKIEKRKTRLIESEVMQNNMSLRKSLMIFILSAGGIVLSGIWLSKVAIRFSEYPFIVDGRTFLFGRTFVGTMILAIITSLPELVVSISAYKMGATNMAVANLFGSCGFNIFIFPLLEPFMGGNSILQFADTTLLIPAVLSILLMSIAVMGLIYRSSKSYLYFGWDGFLIFVFYIAGSYLFFMANVFLPQMN